MSQQAKDRNVLTHEITGTEDPKRCITSEPINADDGGVAR